MSLQSGIFCWIWPIGIRGQRLSGLHWNQERRGTGTSWAYWNPCISSSLRSPQFPESNDHGITSVFLIKGHQPSWLAQNLPSFSSESPMSQKWRKPGHLVTYPGPQHFLTKTEPLKRKEDADWVSWSHRSLMLEGISVIDEEKGVPKFILFILFPRSVGNRGNFSQPDSSRWTSPKITPTRSPWEAGD